MFYPLLSDSWFRLKNLHFVILYDFELLHDTFCLAVSIAIAALTVPLSGNVLDRAIIKKYLHKTV